MVTQRLQIVFRMRPAQGDKNKPNTLSCDVVGAQRCVRPNERWSGSLFETGAGLERCTFLFS